jgi:hypothetical protein
LLELDTAGEYPVAMHPPSSALESLHEPRLRALLSRESWLSSPLQATSMPHHECHGESRDGP